MGWADLLAKEADTVTVPWTGGRRIYADWRTFSVDGRLPKEFGWHRFLVGGGRTAEWQSSAEPDFNLIDKYPRITGYLVGNRLIHDEVYAYPDPNSFATLTLQLHLAEPVERFARAAAIRYEEQNYIYIQPEFPLGPEAEVTEAYQDRLDSIDHIKNVTPALNLAFRFETLQRRLAEEREAERERQRLEEERKQQLRKMIGTGAGRRALAKEDFGAAARAALAASGAELLDWRPAPNKKEMIVQFRFERQRFECVVNANTLRITDAGICLDDHRGTKGDTFFTLESLPPVIAEAIKRHKLVVWRHV